MPVVHPLAGEIPEGAVVVIPLNGEVSQAQFFFLRRILKAGEAAHASAFILDMDTPGGELGAGVEILQALLQVKAPTFTYVNPNAGSAGALIALGTKQIWIGRRALRLRRCARWLFGLDVGVSPLLSA